MTPRRIWRALCALAVVLQLVVLYSPTAPAVPAPTGSDKVVHVAVFLLPAVLGVLAGLSPLPLGLALAAHAGVSEVVQGLLLPTRSGDVADAAADLAGVAIGVAVGSALRRRAPRVGEREIPVPSAERCLSGVLVGGGCSRCAGHRPPASRSGSAPAGCACGTSTRR